MIGRLRSPRPLDTPRRSRRRGDGELGGVYRRLWVAMLGLALVPMGLALVLAMAFAPSPDPNEGSRRAWETSEAAATLAAAQQRLGSRLVGLAGDASLTRLLDGVSGSSDQQVASRVLAALQDGGPGVTTVCLVRPGGTVAVALGRDGRPGADASACTAGGLGLGALGAEPGSVAHGIVRAPDGSKQLVLGTALRSGGKRTQGAITASVALPELMDAMTGLSARPAAALLVDPASGDIVADGGRRLPGSAAIPTDLGVRVSGIVAGHGGTMKALRAAGWEATSAPLPLGGDGPPLALVTLWPAVAPEPPILAAAALVILAGSVLAVAVVLARGFQRPFEALTRSQAQLEVMYTEAREDSLHDGLTGLGNHRAFREELDRQMEISRRHGVAISLLLVDLDDLKVVNDTEGHAAGDELIRGMAAAIRDSLRYGDRAFRIGGDEFAIILPHTDAASARVPASRLLQLCLHPAPGERRIAFSGGISAVPEPARDRDEVYRQADAALYWCKRHGRASVEVFDPDRDEVERDSDADSAGSAVHDTVRRRLLRPVYQPIVDLRTGAVLGFEGLVRPTAGSPFEGPGDLFAAAAASGRTVELDLACLEVVAQGARTIDAARIISINLSPKTLEAHDFTPRWLLEHLGRQGIAPGRVIIEVTEREPVTDLETFTRNVASLQHAGIRVAADDVGAGNAGLRLLSKVRFDVVKIDLSLVQEGAQRGTSQAVLRSLQDLASRQRASVIAEGVETAEQLEVLRDLGVPAAQGFLLGRPGTDVTMSAVDLAALQSGALFLGAGAAAARAVAVPSGPLATST